MSKDMTIRRILTHLERIFTSQLDSARDAPVSLNRQVRSIINQFIIMTTERILAHPDAHRSKSLRCAPVSHVRQVRSTHDQRLLAARSAVRRSQWHLELLKFAPGAGLPAQSLRKFPTQNAVGPGESAPTENPCGTRVDSRGTTLRAHEPRSRTPQRTTPQRPLNESLGPTRRRSIKSFSPCSNAAYYIHTPAPLEVDSSTLITPSYHHVLPPRTTSTIQLSHLFVY
jgi:hypothetical protein